LNCFKISLASGSRRGAIVHRKALTYYNPASIVALHVGNATAARRPQPAWPAWEMTVTNNSFALIVAVSTLLLAPASADDATPNNEHGRYTFTKVTDGLLRLDGQTGQVSLCAQRTVGWTCQAVPEDRAVLENEIARLRNENVALKKELLAHNLPLPDTAVPESPEGHGNDVTIHLPSNAEIDRAIAYVGQLWQRFVDAMARAQKQMLNKS